MAPSSAAPSGRPPNPLGRWFWRRIRVRGPSMAPALRDADIVLVRRTAAVRPGQIALVRWPSRPGQLSVKRVIRRFDETSNGWFVVGDNRFASTDSRELGPAEVLGVVHYRLWPHPGRLRRME